MSNIILLIVTHNITPKQPLWVARKLFWLHAVYRGQFTHSIYSSMLWKCWLSQVEHHTDVFIDIVSNGIASDSDHVYDENIGRRHHCCHSAGDERIDISRVDAHHTGLLQQYASASVLHEYFVHCIQGPAFIYMRSVYFQFILRICAVWSESFLVRLFLL